MLDYERIMVVGLRSNPKLSYKADYAGGTVVAMCGLRCRCYGTALVEKGQFDHALKLAKAEAIKKHDKSMRLAKRNRIRARNPGSLLIGPVQVRRQAREHFRNATAGVTLANTWLAT